MENFHTAGVKNLLAAETVLIPSFRYAIEEYYADEDHYANFITFDN